MQEAAKKVRSDQPKKGRIANFRVTAEEYQKIEQEADRVGLTFGSYLRKRALHQRISDDVPEEARTRTMRRPTLAHRALGTLQAQLNKIGGLFNQLAKQHNSGQHVPAAELQAALASHRQITAAIIHVLGKDRP